MTGKWLFDTAGHDHDMAVVFVEKSLDQFFRISQVPAEYLNAAFDTTKHSLINDITGNITDQQSLLGGEPVTAVEFNFTSTTAGTSVTAFKVQYTHCSGQYGMSNNFDFLPFTLSSCNPNKLTWYVTIFRMFVSTGNLQGEQVAIVFCTHMCVGEITCFTQQHIYV